MSRTLSPDGALIHPDCKLSDCNTGAYTEVGRGSILSNVVLGDYSYCARGCDIANATIGKFANIAANVRIGPTDHPMERASLHHFLYRSEMYWPDEAPDEAFFARRAARRVAIGHDVWIGHGAIIRPGVSIGTGAVVGAGAVVTRDVAPYTIVVGVPAEKLRRRFSKQTARRLMDLAWWDWDHDRLRMALHDFRTLEIEDFLAKYEDVLLH